MINSTYGVTFVHLLQLLEFIPVFPRLDRLYGMTLFFRCWVISSSRTRNRLTKPGAWMASHRTGL
jgi:hypothetical protein